MEQISTREFVRGRYQEPEAFVVAQRGEPIALWLPIDQIDLSLLERIREAFSASETGPE